MDKKVFLEQLIQLRGSTHVGLPYIFLGKKFMFLHIKKPNEELAKLFEG